MTILEIQTALKAAGFDPGPLDGVPGRTTIAAIRGFQAARRLTIDGVAGPETLNALVPGAKVVAVTPPWMAEAERLVGVREKVGPGSNPTILDWAKHVSAYVAAVYKDDATAWCGLFVGHAIGVTLPDEALPANPLYALNWAKFGVPLKAGAPGAVCVFKRTGGGHVGFYTGEDRAAGTIRVLGGNQSDQVGYANVSAARLVALRWPASVPVSIAGPVDVTAAGPLSTNEA